jgi:hypothetical protein
VPEEVQKANGDAEGEGEWENVDDDEDEDNEGEDEESKAAVNRVLKKYKKAQVMMMMGVEGLIHGTIDR